MIVNRLLNLVSPSFLYLGEKDFQQLVIVKTMVQDLFIPVTVLSCPIVRESDGLAMSSRNQYLSAEERSIAPVIYQALQASLKGFQTGDLNSKRLLARAASILCTKLAIQCEYLAVINPKTLKPKGQASENDKLIFAGRLGKIRLIDNIALTAPHRIS